MPQGSVLPSSPHWPSTLAGTFHCWGIDLRGHGHSDRPADGDFAWSGFRPGRAGRRGSPRVAPAVCLRPLLWRSLHPVGRAGPTGHLQRLYCFEPIVFPADDPVENIGMDNPLSTGALRRRETLPFPCRGTGQLQLQAALRHSRSRRPFRLRRVRFRAGAVTRTVVTVPWCGCAAAERTKRPSTPRASGTTPSPTGAIGCPVALSLRREHRRLRPSLPGAVRGPAGSARPSGSLAAWATSGPWRTRPGGRLGASALVPAPDTPSS